MSAIDLDQATAFIHDADDPMLASFAHYINGQASREDVIQGLKTHQREDGGWAKTDKDFMGDISNITATLVGLQWLNWLGDRDSPLLQHTLDFLRNTQRADGRWDEPEAMADFDPLPPFWMLPGRRENQLWLTAAIACQVQGLGQEQQVDFPAAIDFVRQGWNGREFPMYPHTHWMAMPLFSRLDSASETDAQISAGCKKFLYALVEKDDIGLGDIIQIAHAAHAAGDSAEDLLDLTLAKIKENQQSDGGWTTDHGDQHRAHNTVDALLLYKKNGLI